MVWSAAPKDQYNTLQVFCVLILRQSHSVAQAGLELCSPSWTHSGIPASVLHVQLYICMLSRETVTCRRKAACLFQPPERTNTESPFLTAARGRAIFTVTYNCQAFLY